MYFSIPFRVDQSSELSRQPVAVQLLVSQDNGANWRLYTKALPDQKQIPFRTAMDGEYWFAVRTVDRAGRFHPQTIPGPGLRVSVDTAPPQMKLSARSGPAGQITVSWQINDPHLKPESFSLQYRISPDGAWQTVAVEEKNSTVAENIQSGEVSWWPQPGSHEIQIRAETADAAGNKAVSHAQVAMGQDMAPKPGLTAIRGNEGDASSRPAIGRTEQLTNRPDFGGAQAGPTLQGFNPPIGNHYQVNSQNSTDPEIYSLPAGQRPKMINTRTFELDYDLESVGPSGISRVELWGTRDGGRSWRVFAVDDDNRSPISVTVDEEGIYGFRVVALSGAGLGEQAPKSGDPPSISIGVDLTKPLARITGAELGKGAEEGRLIITWEAADKLLAERPITLAFSLNSTGPWNAIVAGLENTGRYDWTIDSRVPPLIYLRLEVRDEAGNLTIQECDKPVALDQQRPTAKIREVRPMAKSGAAQ